MEILNCQTLEGVVARCLELLKNSTGGNWTHDEYGRVWSDQNCLHTIGSAKPKHPLSKLEYDKTAFDNSRLMCAAPEMARFIISILNDPDLKEAIRQKHAKATSYLTGLQS